MNLSTKHCLVQQDAVFFIRNPFFFSYKFLRSFKISSSLGLKEKSIVFLDFLIFSVFFIIINLGLRFFFF